MKNYSELSDFEINKAVAIHRGHQCYYGDGSYTNDGLNVTVKGNGRIGWFNPCRLPEDAWPIIVENRIMLNPYCADNEWKSEVPCGVDGSFTKYATAYHKNPLRAAMIVYLMMKDGE